MPLRHLDHLRLAARALFLAAALVAAVAASSRAATISGTVKNQNAVPVANVDIDFVDQCTGANIILINDKTAFDGTYSIVVPSGTYDIRYTPPSGSPLTAGERPDYVVSVSANLGTTTLRPGPLVSGTVLTPGFAPASDVELRFTNVATGNRVYLSKTATNLSGQYAIRVPSGTYDVDYRPPSGTAYADAKRLGLVVATSDVSGLLDTLRAGVAVTGIVQNAQGTPIDNVDVDVFDECTGRSVPTAHDNTAGDGTFTIAVPPGTYTFEYDPPRCQAVEAWRAPNTVVTGATSLGTVQLRPAVLVTGVVHDDAGHALLDAKIKFYDTSLPGDPRQAAARDHSDSTGAFAIYLPLGTYDVDVDPPAGSIDRVGYLPGVTVSGATSLGTVTLAAGIPVTAHVVGPGNVPALYVDVNAVDSATRVAERLAHDDTDEAGDLTVVVAPGTYDFQYAPPACTGLAPASQKAVTVTSGMTLPTVSLVAGVHASGHVLDSGGDPVANVDLDFFTPGTTDKVFTPNDETGADGSYDVVVAPASYDIEFLPPSGTRLRPVKRTNVSLGSSQTLPDVVLVGGWLVSGYVKDANTAAPVDDVVVDFYPPGGSTPLWTVHHTSGSDGNYSVAVDPGTWDILYTPPAGSTYAPLWRTGVVVSNDVSLSDALLLQQSTGARPPSPGLAGVWASPNPASRSVTFFVSTAAPDADLSVWDGAGRRIATLWHGTAAGTQAVAWNGTRDDGTAVPAGLYFARLASATGAPLVRRIVLLR